VSGGQGIAADHGRFSVKPGIGSRIGNKGNDRALAATAGCVDLDASPKHRNAATTVGSRFRMVWYQPSGT